MYLVSSGFSFKKKQPHPHQSSSSTQFRVSVQRGGPKTFNKQPSSNLESIIDASAVQGGRWRVAGLDPPPPPIVKKTSALLH